MAAPNDYVTAERHGRVLVVTLNNPARLNTYDGPGLKAVAAIWEQLDNDSDLRAGVITGEGERAFCAGADVEAAASGGFDDPPYPDVAEGLARKPIIAAIEGLCLGGGMMIAAGCDLRIAGSLASFGLPEARWNLPTPWLGVLARQLRSAHVLELSLLADERVGAQRMYEMGWVNRVVPAGQALTTALDWAERIASLAPAALRAQKELAQKGAWLSPTEARELGLAQANDLVAMADTAEGARAFAERRPPEFEDK